ncbi:phosphatidylglycerophosphatase B [Serratia sp. S1B]|nr:phosphatidylglycerophosphatase B [Serratia sp. S1B]
MLEITKRIIGGGILLLLLPLLVWLSGWQWQPGGNEKVLKVLYWVTETVSLPWGILTSLLLGGWFLWCLRFRLKPSIGIFMLLMVAMLSGQGIKSVMKEWKQEPRPFVMWLESNYHIDEKTFYSLPRKERGMLVKEQLQDQQDVPVWLINHWQSETGFAFPSGHTLFATTWALLAMVMLWPRRHYKTVTLLMLWAYGVMASRLLLGMHWPKDLMMSVVISGLLVAIVSRLAQRWCDPFSEPMKSRRNHHD